MPRYGRLHGGCNRWPGDRASDGGGGSSSSISATTTTDNQRRCSQHSERRCHAPRAHGNGAWENASKSVRSDRVLRLDAWQRGSERRERVGVGVGVGM